ncbi:LysE family transporter [Rhizobium sp. SG2393]|uniref:LysE family transporter n=1 Tax=Rhizobium sp. SG2393 TaxID=3276279 RepID=UPI00366EEF4D
MELFMSAWVLGLSIALPLGPVSLQCVEQSLAQGARSGLASGAGAATSHCLHAAVAVLGARTIALPLAGIDGKVHVLLGLLLALLGLRSLLRARTAVGPRTTISSRGIAYLKGAGLALSNPATPLTYVSFAAATATARATDMGLQQTAFVCGAGLGALSCYATLITLTTLVGRHLPQSLFSRLHLVSGPILIVMGLMMAVR